MNKKRKEGESEDEKRGEKRKRDRLILCGGKMLKERAFESLHARF